MSTLGLSSVVFLCQLSMSLNYLTFFSAGSRHCRYFENYGFPCTITPHYTSTFPEHTNGFNFVWKITPNSTIEPFWHRFCKVFSIFIWSMLQDSNGLPVYTKRRELEVRWSDGGTFHYKGACVKASKKRNTLFATTIVNSKNFSKKT